jgi:hypothetical protein
MPGRYGEEALATANGNRTVATVEGGTRELRTRETLIIPDVIDLLAERWSLAVLVCFADGDLRYQHLNEAPAGLSHQVPTELMCCRMTRPQMRFRKTSTEDWYPS